MVLRVILLHIYEICEYCGYTTDNGVLILACIHFEIPLVCGKSRFGTRHNIGAGGIWCVSKF